MHPYNLPSKAGETYRQVSSEGLGTKFFPLASVESSFYHAPQPYWKSTLEVSPMGIGSHPNLSLA